MPRNTILTQNAAVYVIALTGLFPLTSKKPKKTEKHYAAGKNKPAAVAAHASGLPFHL
jgi:hypothetical protein